ncbi:hypothetical protein PBY51_008476 [Eleginops maclovinus]|uniref:Uncharacterized protein n=1 Tax=Eleginops maclovinus TaxID=56733 RepID=A0AAN8AB72_ELEMC|nr:hypothetical protein PBY51_008476 [Eleginops maclovinus]
MDGNRGRGKEDEEEEEEEEEEDGRRTAGKGRGGDTDLEPFGKEVVWRLGLGFAGAGATGQQPAGAVVPTEQTREISDWTLGVVSLKIILKG